jgi:hypothetical protein
VRLYRFFALMGTMTCSYRATYKVTKSGSHQYSTQCSGLLMGGAEDGEERPLAFFSHHSSHANIRLFLVGLKFRSNLVVRHGWKCFNAVLPEVRVVFSP